MLYRLLDGRTAVRIPVEGDFLIPSQVEVGTDARPASYSMASFPEVNRREEDIDLSPSSSTQVQNESS
jgi:hypothetical protein